MIAWYGDMDLASHAWRLLGLGPIDAHIRIGPPVPLDDFPDRKALARYAEDKVRKDVVELLRERGLAKAGLTPSIARLNLTVCAIVTGAKVPSCSCRICSFRRVEISAACTPRSVVSASAKSPP